MEISKEYADKLIAQALELLESAHHGYYKNAVIDAEVEKDDAIVDAIEALQAFEEV